MRYKDSTNSKQNQSDNVFYELSDHAACGSEKALNPNCFSGQFVKTRPLRLARTTEGGVRNTGLSEWKPTAEELCSELSDTHVGQKDGTYFVRTYGTRRSDQDLSDEADILILDGDARLSESGEVLDGCVSPELVSKTLSSNGIPHVIYMSHSNLMSPSELNSDVNKSTKNRGGVEGSTYHKWRAVIFVQYRREQLEALLDWIFELLHLDGVMVAPVKENLTWAQAWYFSRAIDAQREFDAKKSTQENLKGFELNAVLIHDEWLRHKAETAVEAVPTRPQNEYRSVIDEYNRTHDPRDLLVGAGYVQTDKNRYLHPNSTSGVPGTIILTDPSSGQEFVYSHSGSDPLSDGKRHDAFDLYKHFEHKGDFNAAFNCIRGLSGHSHHELSVVNSFDALDGFHVHALPSSDSRDGNEDTRPLTESGNTLRFLDKHQDSVRFVIETKNAWLIWNGRGWIWSKDGAEIAELMAGIAADIYQEASLHLRDSAHFTAWARASQKKTTITNTVALLANKSEIRVPLSLVDANPYLIGFDGAQKVIDLRTGIARNAEPDDLITKSLRVNQLGCAEDALRWHQFLNQVFNNDPMLIAWLKRYLGYMLTGVVDEQIFVFGFGLGANGKSVLAEILRFIMADYSRTVAPETISESRRSAGSAAPDLMTLLGARLAISTETEDGLALNETLVKLLTGGDAITARGLYQSPVEFKP
ncbi:MAG: hypothetical protein FJ190_04105 [Gammaproteobacteria bacterium]|nr:hypothetical protein [Gammaproteobacteria bacterium]